MAAYACVIGNPSSGKDHRPEVVADAKRVVDYLRKRGVTITNESKTVGMKSAEMGRAVAEFRKALSSEPALGIFYYCGHAVEKRNPKDILLLGDDGVRGPQAGKSSLSLLGYLKELTPIQGLKIVVIDGCRIADDGDKESGVWESFEDTHWETLSGIPDLYIVTASTSGAAAFQGYFTAALVERAEAAVNTVDELALPLEGWFRNVLGDIGEKYAAIQRPSFFCYMRTQEWTIGDLVKDPKELSMVQKDKLDAAQRELDATIEDVRTRDNGIQYLMTSIYSNSWEPPRSTPFLAEDHSTEPPTPFVTPAVGERIKALAEQQGVLAYNAMKNGTFADAGAIPCMEIPDPYSKLLLYRWRCEPNRSFIFLAGGVGTTIKADQFHKYSQAELDAKNGSLGKALGRCTEAHAEAYRSG